MEASRDFQVFAKPAGAICNLDCAYCYYLGKRHLFSHTDSFRMPDVLLEEYIVQHIEASPGPAVSFSWHGGEPMILGLDYFRKIVALQRKHQEPGQHVINGIQTNGVFLDDAWCRFFLAEGFGVGLSLDGPREMHDPYRVTKGKKPTHEHVMRGFKLLRQYGIPCDILCVVHDQNVQYPTEIYRFFKEIGAQYVSFLPIVAADPNTERGVTSQTVPAEAFGTFLCTIFDEWVLHDVRGIMVQIFDEASRPELGLEHSLCIFREICGDIPVVEFNGDFFSCDHFVEPEHRLGNILETPLVELLESPEQRSFGEAKRKTLPVYCQKCDVRPVCNGGCPKNRFILTPDGEQGLNYLCPAFKRFFTHSRPHLRKLVSKVHSTQVIEPPSRPVAVRAPGIPKTRRNDPCPCGSGRKFKKCCLGKRSHWQTGKTG